MAGTPKITFYTRKGCCLCDDAKRVIRAAGERVRFDLDEVDIDADPALEKLYNDEVPVIAINGAKAFKYRVTVDELLRKLQARA